MPAATNSRPWPPGDGEMAERIRDFDWTATPLGPIAGWPQGLKTIVDLMLASQMPMGMVWGAQDIVLYNDGYRSILGSQDRLPLGQPVSAAFPEVREAIAPHIAAAREGGTVELTDQRYPFIRDGALRDAWFDISCNPLRGERGELAGVLAILRETTGRVLAERELRANEERQAFLLRLQDALRPLPDPASIQGEVTRLLGEHLQADRTYYCRVDNDREVVVVDRDYVRGAGPSLVGRYAFETYGTVMARIRDGRTWVVPDVLADRELDRMERELLATQQVTAWVDVPLIKGGQLVAILCVTQREARHWTGAEVGLIEDVAERTWAAVERARAEAVSRTSQERFRRLFESMDEGFCVIEKVDTAPGAPLDFRHVEANAGFTTQSGVTDVVGKTIRSVVPQEPDAWYQTFDAVAMHGTPARFERELATNGRMLEVYAFPLGDRAPYQVAVIFKDITERKRTEAALRESEARYRTLFETMGQGYCDLELVRDADGRAIDQRYLELNPAYERLIGIPIAAAKGRTASDVMPELEPWWTETFDRIVKRGEPDRIEYEVASLGRWYEVFAYPRGGDRLTVLYEDITERKRAEQALRVSEARFRTLVQNLPDFAIFMVDPEGIIIDWTEGAERVTGYTAAEAIGRPLSLFYTPEEIAAGYPERELAEAAATGRAEREAWRVRKAGDRFWADEIATAVRDEAGRLIGFTKISRDLTERRRAEEALQASEERYRTLFESIDQGFCTVEVLFDGGGRAVDYIFLEINPAFARNTGLSEAVGKSMRALEPAHEEFWFETYGRIALTGEAERFEAEAAALGRWYNVYAYRIGEPAQHRVAILFEDITKRRQAEAALRASEEHQAFMLDVSDALRPLADPIAIQATAARLLAEHLGASRVIYAEIEADDAHFTVHRDYVDGVPSFAGRYVLDSFGPGFVNDFRAGRTVTVADAERDVRVSEAERAVYAAGKVRAFVAVPLVKGGRLVADLSLHHPVPHEWSSDEIALAKEVAERTWAAVERARAEEARQASETQFRTVANLVPDLLWQSAPDGSANWYNDRWYEYTGQTEAEAARRGWADVVHPDDRARSAATFARAIETGKPLQQEHRLRAADGSYRWFLVRAEPLRDAAGAIARWFGAATDVHDARVVRDDLTHQVDAATAELRALSRRLINVQEEERRFLARELHDEIGQVLTGLGLQLGSQGTVDVNRLAEARRIVRELTEQVRQLSAELRPAVLDRYGLLPALLWLIERYQTRTGVQVDLRHEGVDRRFPADVEIAVYRLMQEALTNIARHAGTPQAMVRLFVDAHALIVVVRDDGAGFDPAVAAVSSGLGGMRERIELLGGSLSIESAPGTGTIISAELDFDRDIDRTRGEA